MNSSHSASSQSPSPHEPGDLVDGMLMLHGPCEIKDGRGRAWRLTSLWMSAEEGLIHDVYARLEGSGALGAHLYDDETFTEGVMKRLASLGYRGAGFGRAELGMQQDGCIALEPNREFKAFAKTLIKAAESRVHMQATTPQASKPAIGVKSRI